MTSVYYAKKTSSLALASILACTVQILLESNFDNLKRQMYAAHSQHDVCGLLSNFKITPFVGTFILSLVFTFVW